MVAVGLTASCGGRARPAPGGEPARPLAAYAAQRLLLTPLASLRTDTLGFAQQIGGPGATARLLDSTIVGVLTARGLARGWVLPADLARSYERNRTYAADPYRLAVEPLRSPRFVTAERFGEPLSTQLRTMIALHEDARFVLMPIELRFEPEDRFAARAVLKAALLDPRFAQAVWVGDVKGDPARTGAQAVTSAASRLIDLFIAP